MTTTINIKEHLAEYLINRYYDCDAGACVFPPSSDIYVLLSNLMSKRPSTNPVDRGNLCVQLPCRRDGKNPNIYNYLSPRSVRTIERVVEGLFWTDIHAFMCEQKNRFGIDYLTSAGIYLCDHGITAISEDALTKHYYRFRERKKNFREKRKYSKNNLTTSVGTLSNRCATMQ